MSISVDEAYQLLFDKNDEDSGEVQYMDEYGNYVFPTDLVSSTPNTAVGTPSGSYEIAHIRV